MKRKKRKPKQCTSIVSIYYVVFPNSKNHAKNFNFQLYRTMYKLLKYYIKILTHLINLNNILCIILFFTL